MAKKHDAGSQSCGKDNAMLKVLIVEDELRCHRDYEKGLEANPDVTLIRAYTIEEAEKEYAANPDVACIVMDACVPGDRITTIPLILTIRKTFAGPMIAASSMDEYRAKLMNVGCNHEAPKYDVPRKIREVLGL